MENKKGPRLLAAAVLLQAMSDYADALITLRKNKSSRSQRHKAQKTKREIEDFFQSELCAFWLDLAGLSGTDLKAIVATDPIGVKNKVDKTL